MCQIEKSRKDMTEERSVLFDMKRNMKKAQILLLLKKEKAKKNGFTETRTQDPVCVRHM